MSCTSEEETDVSEFEIEEYAEQCYEQLIRDGNEKVKISSGIYRCPFCCGKKQEYRFKDLYQHAWGVGNGSAKITIKDKANHLALVRYLDNKLDGNDRSVELQEISSHESHLDKNEVFVYPWMGILANVPVEKRGRRTVGESGSKIRENLIREGFNPIRVHPLWNPNGFSGYALVEFNSDWPGFSSAMAFEKSYEADCHGKKEYLAANFKGNKLYGWVARENDYCSSGIIGFHLQKKGDLRTIADIEAEEKQKTSILVTSLTNEIEAKNSCLKEIECKYNETSMSLSSLITEKDEMIKQYNEEIQKMQERAQSSVENVLVNHEKFKLQLEAQSEKLRLLEKELENREANNEDERQKFNLQKKMNAEATLKQQKAEKKILQLAEEHKMEKEKLHKKIIDLEKKLDAKQALELEIQHLRGAEQVMKHMGQDGDEQVKNQLIDIQLQLKEKEEYLECLEETNRNLLVKQLSSNDELQEARKELITGLVDQSFHTSIGIKKMGELEWKKFRNSLKGKFSSKEVELKSVELCSLWQDYLRDPNWHPFKVVKIEGTEDMQEIIDENDEMLNGLMNEYGSQVYEIVVTALKEMNEYNPSGRYPIAELWNFSENRRASLKEAIGSLRQWKQKKRKRT